MKKNLLLIILLAAVSVLLFLNLRPYLTVSSIETGSEFQSQENLLMATLYQHFAAEYKAICLQTYQIGMKRLDEIRIQKPDANNLAVIVDIDETILDNSPYQALLIKKNISYDSCWESWCKMASARAIPGSLDFLNKANLMGFKIFYITNRKSGVAAETILNLRNLGFPQLEDANLLFRKVGIQSKESRRKAIQENHEIVLMVGDNLGDFYEDESLYSSRMEQINRNSSEFGTRYLVLPNAMYGNWPASIGIRKGSFPVDSLLNIMTNSIQECMP